MKKAQISMFVIIATIIALIAVVSSLIYFSDEDKTISLITSEPKIENTQVINFKSSLEKCFENQLINSEIENAMIGGYHSIPPQFIQINSISVVPYYILDSNNLSPTNQLLEDEIEKAFGSYIFYCENEISEQYKDVFNIIEFGNLNIDVQISNTSIIADVNLATSLNSSNTNGIVNLEKYNVEIDSNYLNYYKIILKYIDIHSDDYSELPISKLSELSDEYNFTYTIQPINRDTMIYSFIFENNLSNNIPIVFKFAIKYNWEED